MTFSQFVKSSKAKFNKVFADLNKTLSTDTAKRNGNILFSVLLLTIATVLFLTLLVNLTTTFFGIALIGLAITNVLIPGSVTNPLAAGFNRVVTAISDFIESGIDSVKRIFAKPKPKPARDWNALEAESDEDLPNNQESEPSVWTKIHNNLPANPFAWLFSAFHSRSANDLYQGSYKDESGAPILGRVHELKSDKIIASSVVIKPI